MRIILSFLFFPIMATSYGQQYLLVKGVVVDSLTNNPLVAVTAKLTNSSNSHLGSTATNTHGVFTLRIPKKDSHSLIITNIGYLPKMVRLDFSNHTPKKIYDLGRIYLTSSATNLETVEIKTFKPRIKQEIDRLIYDVQADKDNKVQNLLELMAKVPLVSFDAEEHILLKGTGSYRIFINGRPSALFANNPREALRAMPASSVKQVEIITTPPAKYDAEGLTGIINIILNKRLVDGYNATIGISYNNTVGTGENLTLSGKKGKLGITGRAYLFQDFKRLFQNGMQRNTLLPYVTYLVQKGRYSYKGSYFTESVELSYDIDSLNLLTSAINFVNSRYDNQTLLTTLTSDALQQPVQNYISNNHNPQRESGLNLDVNYQKGFSNKKDRILTLSYQFQNTPNRQKNQVYFTDKQNYYVDDYRQENESQSEEQTFQIDYVHPSTKFTFEGGAKVILRRNSSLFKTALIEPLGRYESAFLQPGNHFDYSQNVFGWYQSWRFQIKTLELKAGLRLEHTAINSNFATQIRNSYNNLIPVISLQRRFELGVVNLGFTQRISRPGIAQLNPFINRFNPAFAASGNPYLKTVLKNNLELNYNRYGKANLNISTGYSFSNNTIQQVTTLIDSIAYTGFQNLGKDKALALNVSVNYPLSSSISASLNSELNYVWKKGTFNHYEFTNKGLEGYVYSNLNYDFKKKWRLSLSATMRGRDIYLQGYRNGYINSSLRVSRNLFKDKFTIAVAAGNPFSKYRYIIAKTNAFNFVQQRTTQRYFRSFSISINYNINNLTSSIRKNKRGIKNDDLISDNER